MEDSGTQETSASSSKARYPLQDSDPTDVYLPDYRLFDYEHLLSLSDSLVSPAKKEEARTALLNAAVDGSMTYQYVRLCSASLGFVKDPSIENKMIESNEEELRKLNAAIVEAEKDYGDVEVRDAYYWRAHYHCRVGNTNEAIKAYSETFEKTIGPGIKLNIIYSLVRLGLCTGDKELVKKNLSRAKTELERGGDWERLNKFKVFEGLHLMSIRKFKEAANLFLECKASFSATEIVSFANFIFYTIITTMLHHDRNVLKAKLLDSAEVLQVITLDADLHDFLSAFVRCDYKLFMNKLIPISERVRIDRYMCRHYRYFLRTIRLRAYAQFLEPYRTVTLGSMAGAFGVSEAFIEQELSSYMASGRLNSKIDRVNGIIEDNLPGPLDSLYERIIEQGDSLLNRVQNLSRVIDV